MSSTNRFVLDLQGTQSQISIPVTLGDTARKWEISFSDGGAAYTLEDGTLAKLEIKRPTGTYLQTFCQIANNTTVEYDFGFDEITAKTAVVPGIHTCSVDIIDVNGLTVASPRFTMVVSDKVVGYDDINLSDEDISIITAIVTAEGGRIKAESARVNAEDERADAEKERQIAFESFKERLNSGELRGADGTNGANGADGADGADGISPTINVIPTKTGYTLKITDAEGEKTVNIKDGELAAIADYRIHTVLNTYDYKLTVSLLNANGDTVSTDTVDFPLESVVMGGKATDGIITLTLVNGEEIRFSVADLVDGLVSQEDFDDLLKLPYVNAADNGKILRVVGGVWSKVAVATAEDSDF